MLTHIGPPNPKECSKNQFLKNPRRRTAAILKNVKCDISAAIQPILMKFGTIIHLVNVNLTRNHKFKNVNIQDGGRRQSWKSKNCNISENVWPILTNFCTIAHIGPQSLPAVQKIKLLKIQDGGWPPFWKLLNAISQQPFDRFWWNLVRWCTLGFPIWQSTKNIKKLHNPRWWTAAILTRGSAMAEGLIDALVSRNSPTTKHPIWKLESRDYRVALFSRFHTIPECDRHTHIDRQRERIY